MIPRWPATGFLPFSCQYRSEGAFSPTKTTAITAISTPLTRSWRGSRQRTEATIALAPSSVAVKIVVIVSKPAIATASTSATTTRRPRMLRRHSPLPGSGSRRNHERQDSDHSSSRHATGALT